MNGSHHVSQSSAGAVGGAMIVSQPTAVDGARGPAAIATIAWRPLESDSVTTPVWSVLNDCHRNPGPFIDSVPLVAVPVTGPMASPHVQWATPSASVTTVACENVSSSYQRVGGHGPRVGPGAVSLVVVGRFVKNPPNSSAVRLPTSSRLSLWRTLEIVTTR